MTDRLEHWTCWMERCALGLCPADTRAALQGFADSRFRHYLDAYAHLTGIPAESLRVPPPEAWHRFETWLRLRNTREGKAYKAWLRASPGPADPDHLEAMASLLVRDVVREYLRREVSPAFMTSLDRRPRSGESTAPQPEYLPAVDASTPASHDLDRLAALERPAALERLSWRQRLALLARQLGLALSHPVVLRAAGCGKTMLARTYTRALRSLAAHVETRFTSEPPATQADLAVRLYAAIQDDLRDWGRAETACAEFFGMSGGGARELRAAPGGARGNSHAYRT